MQHINCKSQFNKKVLAGEKGTQTLSSSQHNLLSASLLITPHNFSVVVILTYIRQREGSQQVKGCSSNMDTETAWFPISNCSFMLAEVLH